jgi:5-methyltetrahydrofolate--homocysteine methyltransferase
VKRYEQQHDDYQRDHGEGAGRSAGEAFAEYLHARVRREWGYGARASDADDLHRGEVSRHPAGVRLPGLPGSHGEDQAVRSAGAERVGIKLTESCAMLPAASVSGSI